MHKYNIIRNICMTGTLDRMHWQQNQMKRERKKSMSKSWRRRHEHTRKQNQNMYDTPASAIIIRGVSLSLRRFNSRRACRFPDYCAACFCSFVPFHLYSFAGRALYGWKFLHVSAITGTASMRRAANELSCALQYCSTRCLRGTLVIQTEKLL